MTKQHKLWYSRGYIPHFDSPHVIQMITYRLDDAMPPNILNQLKIDSLSNTKRRKESESILDSNYGKCHLSNPKIAKIVVNNLVHFHNQRYCLLAWIVMPNHVHVLIDVFEGFTLGQILFSWKSYTARASNKILGKRGRFWQRDYFDRYIRNEAHLYDAINYIHMNPVKAGLVDKPEDWTFSSARFYYDGFMKIEFPQ